eukprot:1544612-Amphidinium_carterae.4
MNKERDSPSWVKELHKLAGANDAPPNAKLTEAEEQPMQLAAVRCLCAHRQKRKANSAAPCSAVSRAVTRLAITSLMLQPLPL